MPSASQKPSRPSEVRLQKFLADCGLGSRRACEQWIVAGRVSVGDRVVCALGARVDPACSSVKVDGCAVRPQSIHHLVLYKPRGYLCTSADPGGRPTFHDLLPDVGARLYSAGRLDAASEGLLLATNDGALVQAMTHPAGGFEKVYVADLDESLGEGQAVRMLEGLPIDGHVHRAARVRFLGLGRFGARYEITLRQGLHRQIRKMAEACGRRVRRLVRIRFGPIELGSLKPGEWRRLSPREIEDLRRLPVSGLLPKTLSSNNNLRFRPKCATVSGHERNSIMDGVRCDVGEG